MHGANSLIQLEGLNEHLRSNRGGVGRWSPSPEPSRNVSTRKSLRRRDAGGRNRPTVDGQYLRSRAQNVKGADSLDSPSGESIRARRD